MVVSREIHLFASHKGGTGKTLLCFQIACQYAHDHPEEYVLLFDLTELGDLTKRLFGHDTEVIEEECGAIFELLSAMDNQKGFMSSFKKSLGMQERIDFTNSARPSEFNKQIPENVYLVSSGAVTQDGEEFKFMDYANSIRSSIETSDKRWKVFIDTDGDRRPAPFTKLGYCLADLIVVPLQPDFADFHRLLQMIKTVEALSDELEFHAKICQVIWNKLQVFKLDGGGVASFATTKVVEELVSALNHKLYDEAKSSSLFLHGKAPTIEEFTKASVCRVRDFASTVALPSNAKGIPFCTMSSGNCIVGSVTFAVKEDQIKAAVENIADILGRLESMVA